jgi:hypothetical protein
LRVPPEAAEAAVDQPVEGTPPAEQAPAPAATDQAPAKPTKTDAELRSLREADYTRKMQKLAAARKELGLDADASEDDFLTAVKTLRQKAESTPPAQEDESGITDPRYLEMERRATTRLWQAEETVHGPVAVAGRELQDFMRRTSDPEAITEKMYEVLGRFSAEPPAASGEQPEAGGETPAGEPAVPQSFGLNEGGTRTGGTVVAPPEVTDEFRNTGNVEGWMKKLLAGRQ